MALIAAELRDVQNQYYSLQLENEHLAKLQGSVFDYGFTFFFVCCSYMLKICWEVIENANYFLDKRCNCRQL